MPPVIKEPVNALSHLAGALAALICTAALMREALDRSLSVHAFAFAVFGVSLVAQYAASTLYHALRLSERGVALLRRIDHMMIFVLIAGTYTPVCLIPLRGPWGWSLLALVWGFALGGILVKLFWMNAPRIFSTGLYVLMGWLVVIALFPLKKAVSSEAFTLLAAGGLAYTAGAVLYAAKWLPFRSAHLGFHEVFHLFVLAGSLFHMLFMFELFPA